MISGDLFDHARLSDITVGATLEIVTSPGVPVVIIPEIMMYDTKSLGKDVALMCNERASTFLDRLEGSFSVGVEGHDVLGSSHG